METGEMETILTLYYQIQVSPQGTGSEHLGLSDGLWALTQFPCRKKKLTCLPPWVTKEKIETLLLASEMPVSKLRLRTVVSVCLA